MTAENKYKCMCWIKDPLLITGLVLFAIITCITMSMINTKTNITIDRANEIETELNDVEFTLKNVQHVIEAHIEELKISNGISRSRINDGKYSDTHRD